MKPLYGPTFAEMREPSSLPAALRSRARAARANPLDAANLYNITWKDDAGAVEHLVLPPQLTGVAANIIVISGRKFPSGAHKVGPAYALLQEKQLNGEIRPGAQTLVFPSTGNYGIGGAWVGPRLGYRSLVVLPEEMSAERFAMIRGFGAEIIATPGCESNVKEIFDKVRELRVAKDNCILEQFSEFGNYRFHYEVTGSSVCDLVADLAVRRNMGDGKVAAFVSAMGSAGTIAAADKLKQRFDCVAVGVEPVQCPTLYHVGYGAHRIEGIGDKHVTWIHHVTAMDALVCVDEMDCLRGLELLQTGSEHLVREFAISDDVARSLVGVFGVSGICNVIGAIKTAKFYGLRAGQNVVTVATDGFDRYGSVLEKLAAECGPMDAREAARRIDIFRAQRLDHVLEGTREVRRRWHNQKYFTWVEQQGKTVAELDAQLDPDFWIAEQAKISAIDAAILQRRAAGYGVTA